MILIVAGLLIVGGTFSGIQASKMDGYCEELKVLQQESKYHRVDPKLKEELDLKKQELCGELRKKWEH
jgi:hypothetical protein